MFLTKVISGKQSIITGCLNGIDSQGLELKVKNIKSGFVKTLGAHSEQALLAVCAIKDCSCALILKVNRPQC